MAGDLTVGRPTVVTDAHRSKILDLIAGGSTIKRICDKYDELPCRSTIYLELSRNPVFSDSYARAKTAGMEAWADDIIEITDEEKFEQNQAGFEVHSSGAAQRDRLRVDARKWLMSKLALKKYGDKAAEATVAVELTLTPRPRAPEIKVIGAIPDKPVL